MRRLLLRGVFWMCVLWLADHYPFMHIHDSGRYFSIFERTEKVLNEIHEATTGLPNDDREIAEIEATS